MFGSELITDELITRAREDCQSSLAFLFDCLRSDIVWLIRSFRVQPGHFEDAVQDCILIILNCLKAFDEDKGPFVSYVKESIRKALLNPKYHAQPISCDGSRLVSREESPVPKDVKELLSTLPKNQRSMVEAHYGLRGPEQTVRQIAAWHGLTQTAVQKQLTEAFSVLRRHTY